MTMSKKQYINYIRGWLAVSFVLLLIAVTINISVDPYGLFDSPRVEDFNYFKPVATTRVRISKTYQVDKINPKTIIAGNSRPEMGFNPANSCWDEGYRPIYNLGLPGASVYMASRYIQHAISYNEVQQVFWGLDFLDFLDIANNRNIKTAWPPGHHPFEERLRVNLDGTNNGRFYLMQLKDILTSLFSLDTLIDSLYTVSKQKDNNSSTIRRDGFNPARSFNNTMVLEGQGLIFKQKNLGMAKIFSRLGHSSIVNGDDNSEHFEAVRQLLLFARNNNVKVVLFINPYHSDYLATIQMTGSWRQFLSWKKYLTQIAEEFEVPLWDFSGFNDMSTIQPPVIGDTKTLLKWFWEPAHYRKEYGDLMLGQMLDASCGEGEMPVKGVLLKNENIENYISESDASLLRYKFDYPMAIKRLDKVINR